jgi:hypothetical protein
MNNSADKKLEYIANKVIKASGLSGEDRFGNPIAILMVISIILTCIRIIQECNKESLSLCSSAESSRLIYREQIRSYSRMRGWFTKMRIKKILRQEMSHEDYIKYSLKLVGGILNTGESITDDEVQVLVEKINNV